MLTMHSPYTLYRTHMHTRLLPSIPMHPPALTPPKNNPNKLQKKYFHKKCTNHSCRDSPQQIYTDPKTSKTSYNQHHNAYGVQQTNPPLPQRTSTHNPHNTHKFTTFNLILPSTSTAPTNTIAPPQPMHPIIQYSHSSSAPNACTKLRCIHTYHRPHP